jgi:hypothetical protein
MHEANAAMPGKQSFSNGFMAGMMDGRTVSWQWPRARKYPFGAVPGQLGQPISISEFGTVTPPEAGGPCCSCNEKENADIIRHVAP